MNTLNKLVPLREGNRKRVRLLWSWVAASVGEDSAWSEVPPAALDGVPGAGNVGDDDDGAALDDAESWWEIASEAADSAASLDCCCLR